MIILIIKSTNFRSILVSKLVRHRSDQGDDINKATFLTIDDIERHLSKQLNIHEVISLKLGQTALTDRNSLKSSRIAVYRALYKMEGYFGKSGNITYVNILPHCYNWSIHIY